jgi:hypothetical protein
METLYKHHIHVEEGQSPVDVRLTERPFKAYMVANLAFIESPKYAAEQYELSLGAVYAAMSFYEDNREGIEKAIEEARAIDLGDMEMSEERIEEIRQRLNKIKNG